MFLAALLTGGYVVGYLQFGVLILVDDTSDFSFKSY